MAPKNKFTREEMVAAAVAVVRKNGIGALTAKALAKELGTSTQPVFTCFGTMDAVRAEVRAAAAQRFDAYTAKGLEASIPFLGVGTQHIRFAREEPELYRLLFLTRAEDGAGGALAVMRHSQSILRPSLQKVYHMSAGEADRFFRDLWLVVHSLATLIVTDGCLYSDKEIEQILTGFSVSICKAIKELPGFTDGTLDREAIFGKLVQEGPSAQERVQK